MQWSEADEDKGEVIMVIRCGFVLRIRPGCEAEYRRRHREVYPELLATFSRVGIQEYSIFQDGTQLFGFWKIEGDLEGVLRQLDEDPANLAWQEYMRPLMLPWHDGAVVRMLPEVFFFT